jgi:predicted CoA-binding protein
MNVKENEIKNLMAAHKKFCVYGLSPDSTKPGHYVPVYMREQGWQMVGTYPKPHDSGGFKIYQTLVDVPAEYRKFIDVFRASDRIGDVVDEVLEVGGVEVLWLQLGIMNTAEELRAEKAGIKVVSNHCLIPEHKKWFR